MMHVEPYPDNVNLFWRGDERRRVDMRDSFAGSFFAAHEFLGRPSNPKNPLLFHENVLAWRR
jgi:hypothetical protein